MVTAAGVVQHSFGERGLAVVDMRDDALVTDACRIGAAGSSCFCSHG
jgi:hypothetical protein